MAGIPDYSTTAASNATVGSIVWSEGMAPSLVNDSARALMADIAAEATLETVSGTDTYTVTYDITPAAYSTKMRLWLLFTNANTVTTPTLNVNSLGAKTIVDHKGNALAVGAIAAGSIHHAVYGGTYVQLLGTVVGAASATASGIVELATDAETVTGSDTARATTPANITAKMAAPGAIGGTTPSTGAFTTVAGTVATFTKASAGDSVIWTNGGASNKTGYLYSDGDQIGILNVAGGGAGHEAVLLNTTSGTVTVSTGGAQRAQFTDTGLNNTAIGATTAATGAFTTLSATGTVTVPGVPLVSKLTSNFTTTSSTLGNVTGLSFSVASGSYYLFEYSLRYEVSNTATKPIVALTTPTFDTRDFHARVDYSLSGEPCLNLVASGTGVTQTNAVVATTAYLLTIKGTIKPTANGTVQLQAASSDNTNTLTIAEGSCQLSWLL